MTRLIMPGPKLLQVCLLIGWATSTLCLRHVDPTRLIADRPKHQPKPLPWDQHSNSWRNKQAAMPPYAVKMEPVVHYSQQDPLYLNANKSSTAKIDFDSHASGSDIGIASNYGPPPNPVYGVPYQPDYYKEPEPIIEIIIKESNESLPSPPTSQPSLVTRPPKEPVQVFYVKYKKNPNSYGDKEDIIYESPVPAITPSTEAVSESETTFSTESSPIYNYATGPPAPSTTFRTIIKPDSEVYHGTGLKVTFGKSEENWTPSVNEAQKRDSASEIGDTQNKVKKNADKEFKRSFIQPSPQLIDHQRNNNNFETSQIISQPQFNGFNTPKPDIDLLQPQQRKPSQAVQNYFREDNLRPNFQGQIPILNQQFKPTHSFFEGNVEPKPIDFKDNNRNQQQYNNQPNYQQFNHQPNIQINNQQNHHQLNNQPHLHNQQNHQQFNNHQNHQQFNNQPNHQHLNNQQFINQRQPDFQSNPSLRYPVNFQERPTQINLNNERPFKSISNAPFENHPVQNKPFENRPIQDRPFDNRPFESRLIPDRQFENRPFENIPVQNRPFENQHNQNKPFESRPLYDRPLENRPIGQNRPVENRPIQDRPFDNRQNQEIVNYRPSKPPTPQNIPLNPNPSFVPNDRRPTVPPPQLPSNYNSQPISNKHTPDLAFTPLHQQFQQQQFQQQYGSIDNRPPVNNNPSPFQQQSTKYNQQSNTEIKPSSIPQLQVTPSNNFKLEPKQQPAQSGQFYSRYQQTQTEKNSIRPDNNSWQVLNEPPNSFKQQPQEYKEHLSASTIKNNIDTTKSVLRTTEKPASFVTSQYKEKSTMTPSKPISTEMAKNETKKPDFKNIASLPDEVPDELREQLLSSGILSNADIQILDYDKVGDIPIESLPPEALENLYGQGSAPIPSVVLPPNKSNVQMKVVKYDPSTEEGKKIEKSYVDRPTSHTLDPVVLNDKGYNRFLPLNIDGTHFPIPDSPLLKNKAIGSVVILSPVGYDLSDDHTRLSRNTAVKVKGVHFIVGDIVKNLVKDPSTKNFETWLEKEKSTPSEEQSVVLLVTKPNGKANGKEIYMYDVTHNRVNKLSGELSTTFVDVAESNSHSHDLDNLSSNEEVDVVVSGNSANNNTSVVSGYSKVDDFPSSSVATATN